MTTAMTDVMTSVCNISSLYVINREISECLHCSLMDSRCDLTAVCNISIVIRD